MSKLRLHITFSADGYVAGPNQSLENPRGEGGSDLHEWALALRAFREPHGMEGCEVNASTLVVEESLSNVGAEIMGRGKFGGGPGPWGDDPWQGWWGEDPPFPSGDRGARSDAPQVPRRPLTQWAPQESSGT
jgi:hypothetical protein